MTEDDDLILEGYMTFKNSRKAFEFQADYLELPEWIPFSQSDIYPDLATGRAVVYIRRWLAKKNGWV